MSQVYVETEKLHAEKRRGFFSFWPMEPQPEFIRATELVAVLNSAAEDGPDRSYVLLDE